MGTRILRHLPSASRQRTRRLHGGDRAIMAVVDRPPSGRVARLDPAATLGAD
jgi:hypothetical protein